MKTFNTPEVRSALYGFGAALFALLTVAGVVQEAWVPSILTLLGAGLNVMAMLNTPTKARVARRQAKENPDA